MRKKKDIKYILKFISKIPRFLFLFFRDFLTLVHTEVSNFQYRLHDEVLDQVRLDQRCATGVQSLEDDVRVVIQFQGDDDHLE